jgi:hypothetical protein
VDAYIKALGKDAEHSGSNNDTQHLHEASATFIFLEEAGCQSRKY